MLKWAAAGFGGLTAMSLAYLVIPPITQPSTVKAQLSSPGPMGLPMEREEGSGTARYAAVGLGREITPAVQPAVGTEGDVLPVADISDIKRASSQRWTLRIVDPYESGSAKGGYQTNGPALARRIQNEIRRVGCGAVKVTGYWNKRTKAAMARFVANRNAALPTDKPDVVLLSLLRTYKGNACGRSCNGVWTSDGMCRQLEASATAKHPGLKVGPKAVSRPAPVAVGTNWIGRTTISQSEPPPVATTTGSGHIVTTGPYADETSTRTAQGLVAAPRSISEGRMSLGVPSPYQQQPEREIPAVTVQSPTYVGPTELGTGAYGAVRVGPPNTGELLGAAGLSAGQEIKRQRKSRPQRTYRRRSNWRARVYTGSMDSN